MSGGPAVVASAVGLLVLVAASPWWVAGRGARRRAGHQAAGAGPGEAGSAGPGGAARGVGASPGAGPDAELPVLLELLAAAMRAGAGVPRALEATADAVRGSDAPALRAAAEALRLGADWDTAWRGAPARLGPLRRALRGAWVDGAASSDALRAARDEALHERRAAAATAAARLGVRLVLPLGACFLPAFVLVGLAPVLIALGVDLLSG